MFQSNKNIVNAKKLFQRFNEAYSGNEPLINEMFDVFSLF